MTTFPDMQVVMDDVRVRADCAEYHWTLIGTNTGPGGTGHRVVFFPEAQPVTSKRTYQCNCRSKAVRSNMASKLLGR